MIELCHFRFFWCFFFLWALKVLEVIIQNHRIIYFSFTFSWMTMTFDAILEDIFCRKLVYCQQEIWYNTGCYPSTPFSELAHNSNHMTSFFCVKQQLSSFFSCRLPSSSSLFFLSSFHSYLLFFFRSKSLSLYSTPTQLQLLYFLPIFSASVSHSTCSLLNHPSLSSFQ